MINKNIFVFIKTSSRRLVKTKTKDVFKASSLRRMFVGNFHLGANLLELSGNCDDLVKIAFLRRKCHVNPRLNYMIYPKEKNKNNSFHCKIDYRT